MKLLGGITAGLMMVLGLTGSLPAQERASSNQGPCTEPFIRQQITKPDANAIADDDYFFSGALEKPVVGEAAAEKAFAPVAAQRRNEKRYPLNPDRIVVSPSGDMAYEYGTGQMSFDERDSGKHIAFTAAYLRVWRAVDGSCKQAAAMFEPEDQN